MRRMELNKETLVHGFMLYKCEQCNEIIQMYLEKGVEGPDRIQCCPFTIEHDCGGFATHVMWDKDTFFIPRVLKEHENYFALDLDHPCAKTVLRNGD